MRGQSISINTNGNAPDPSTIPDIQSTTKGLLIPRMTEIERDAIFSAVGSMVYVSPEHALSDGPIIAYVHLSSANTVEVKFKNTKAASPGNNINLLAMNYYITVI